MSHLSVYNHVQQWINSVPSINPPHVVTDTKISATARGDFLGEDNSDPDSQGTQIYREPKNLPTAVASILTHVQKKAKFHPASTKPKQLALEFNRYIQEVDNTPFIGLINQTVDTKSFSSKNYNLLIDQVVNLYKGISGGDLDSIKTSMSEMGKSIFGQEHAEDFKNIFSLSSIDMSNPSNPKFYIAYTSFHMKHDVNGKAEVSEQDYQVNISTYAVLPDKIRAYATSLANIDKSTVDEWTKSSSSRERKDAKLCFRPEPFFTVC